MWYPIVEDSTDQIEDLRAKIEPSFKPASSWGSIYWHARGNLTVSTIQRLGSIIAVARQVLEGPRLAPVAAWSGP